MTEVDEFGQPTPVDENETLPSESPSFVDLIKEDIKTLGEQEEVFIRVPGYSKSGLQIKYRLPENGKELDKIARAVQREFKDSYTRNLYVAIDTMIALCQGVYLQPAGADAPFMLDPEESGTAPVFDARLHEIMAMNGVEPRARAVVKQVFGNNEFAIINHAERLNRWMMDTSTNIELEFWQLGE